MESINKNEFQIYKEKLYTIYTIAKMSFTVLDRHNAFLKLYNDEALVGKN